MADFTYFIFLPPWHNMKPPNGWRYPLGVGGWIHPRNGTPRKPETCSKNAGPTPSRVHALLGALFERRTRRQEQVTTNLTKLLHTAQTFATDEKHDLQK